MQSVRREDDRRHGAGRSPAGWGRRLVGCLMLAGLVLTGCGGGGKKTAGGTTTTSSAPPSAAPSSTESTISTVPGGTDPAKVQKAISAILRAADFPPGFDPDPEAMFDIEAVWRDITSCLGVAETGQPLGRATSVTFKQGLATQARSTVEYLPEARAKALATALGGAKFNQCATQAFTADAKRSAPEGGVPGPVSVAPLAFPKAGQTTSASRATFTMDVQGLKVPITQDLVVAFDGEAVSRLSFLNTGSPFPSQLEQSLVQKVVSRA